MGLMVDNLSISFKGKGNKEMQKLGLCTHAPNLKMNLSQYTSKLFRSMSDISTSWTNQNKIGIQKYGRL